MYKYKNMLTGEVIRSEFEFKKLKPNIVSLNSNYETLEDLDEVIVYRRALGDLLMLFPALELWKKQRKDFRIKLITDDWLVPLSKRQHFIDSVQSYKTFPIEEIGNSGKEVYYLEGGVDTLPKKYRKHRTLLFADMIFKIWSEYDGTDYFYSKEDLSVSNYFHIKEEELELSKQLLKKGGWDEKRPLIAIAPYSKSEFREWRNEFLLMPRMPDYDFVLFHNKESALGKQFNNVINMSGKTSILMMAGMMSLCKAAVLPDSGIMHVAGIIGLPTIGIFGKIIPPENRLTYYPSVKPVESSCPISSDYCYDTQFHTCRFTKHYRKCMKLITATDILKELKILLGRK